jgi:choline dehydrogenase
VTAPIPRVEGKAAPEFDYIIVGAGTAGCVLAARLSEDPAASVLLLEAGSPRLAPAMTVPGAWPELMGTAADWGDITTAQADAGPLPYPRGRALGGSGAINAMAHIRGYRAVYDAWAAHGAAGWDYEDLLPYFCRSEHTEGRHPVLRGTEGPVRVAPVPEPERHPVAVAFAAALAQAGCPATADSAAPSKREWPGLTWLSTAGSGSARLMPT